MVGELNSKTLNWSQYSIIGGMDQGLWQQVVEVFEKLIWFFTHERDHSRSVCKSFFKRPFLEGKDVLSHVTNCLDLITCNLLSQSCIL